MDARLLTRCTNVALVAVVGMGAGHLLVPARATASLASRAAFVVVVALSGAIAAWRERAIATEYRGGPPPGAMTLWLTVGALVSLLLAGMAWFVVHG